MTLLMTLILAGCARGPTPYLAADPAADTSGGYADQPIEDNRFRITYTASPATPVALIEDYLLYRAAELTLESGNDWYRLVSSETAPVVNYFAAAPAPVFTTRIFVAGRIGKAFDADALDPEAAPADTPPRLAGKRDMGNDGQRDRHAKGPRGHRKYKTKHRRRYKRARFHRRKRFRRTGVAIGFSFPLYPAPYYGFGRYGYGPYYPYYGGVRASVTRIEAAAEILVFPAPRPEDAADAYDARAIIETIGPRLPRPDPED